MLDSPVADLTGVALCPPSGDAPARRARTESDDH